jgi:Dockerin type I domain/Divergent InlB B-repeat domain
LTTNESGALNIVEPTSRTPLSGGFVPFVLEYDQVHAQNLPTGSYSAMATMNLYTSPATNLFFPYPLLPDPNYHPPASAINLQVMEPTRTRIAPTPPQVVINGKATFTVTVGPQCGAKPAAPPSRGSNTITGGVEFMDTYQPDYGGEPVTMRLGTIPINNSPSDARDNDNGVMHAVIDGTCAADDTVCAYTLSLGRGRHNITALYHGDDLYGASTSATHIIDVVDPIVPGGVINLTLGSKPSQVVTLTGFPGESFQIFAPPLLSVTPSSGKFVTNSVPVTVAIVDSPTLLPGVINTTFNAVGTLSNGTLFSDTYQQVKITVPTTLSVQQTPLNFTAVDNTPSSGQGIAVTYLGGPLTITPDVSTPQAWIAAGLSTASLTSRGIQTARVAVEVNPAGLAPGHYTGVVRIGAPSGPGVFSVPVSLDVTLSAPHYTITTTPPGLRVVVDGVNQATPVTFQWTTGSRHTLSTPAGFQPAGDGTRAIWTAWSDGGAIAHAITANGSKDYMATFRLQYQLTTQRSPVCGGTVTPTGNWVNAGALAQISASAASGYTFGSFTGDVSSSASSASLLMNQPHSVIANFKCPGGPCTDVLPVTYATGDLNRDGRVDCTDVAIVKAALGKRSGQAGFDARADVNGDGVVDVRDLSLVSQQLPVGSTCQ